MTVSLQHGDTAALIAACRAQNLTREQAAYVLATAYWETAHTMEPVREAFWLSEQWRERNLTYHPWYGRGYVQLTFRDNYERMGRRLNLDLTSDPDVVMEQSTAARIIVVGMREGLFTGQRLDDYIDRDAANFRGARRVVNGMDKAGSIAELAREYLGLLERDGYGVEPPADVADEKRDGTPPRQSPAQSRTIAAQAASLIGTAPTAVWAWLQSSDPMVQVAVAASAGVVALAAIVVFRERLAKWAEGIR